MYIETIGGEQIFFEPRSGHILPVDSCKCWQRVRASTWNDAKSSSGNSIRSKRMQVKRPSKFVQITEDGDNLKVRAQASPHVDCQNTPGTDLQMIKAQTTDLERNFMESSDRKLESSRKDHHYC